MTYIPKPGSIAHQTMSQLAAKPGATLTPADIALKFGKPIGQISSFLHAAIHAGSIKRTINADGGLTYSLGKGAHLPTTPAPIIPGQPRTVWVEVQPWAGVAA